MANAPIATGTTNTTPNSLQLGMTDRLWKPWKISEAGITFIKEWEKFSPKMYDHDGATAGNATIGYGYLVHTGPINGSASEAPFVAGISKERAIELLKISLAESENLINKKVIVPLYQHEYDVLVDFIYNLRNHGIPLLNLVNTGGYSDVTTKLKEYNKAQGKQIPGLTKRRNSEANLFDNGNYDASH